MPLNIASRKFSLCRCKRHVKGIDSKKRRSNHKTSWKPTLDGLMKDNKEQCRGTIQCPRGEELVMTAITDHDAGVCLYVG